MANIFLGLGSNMGNRQQWIEQAIGLIDQRVGCVLKQSKIHETSPVGFESETMFLNCVVQVTSQYEPLILMDQLLTIEKELGRERLEGKLCSRTIDIDLLFYDNLILDTPRLVVPHPRIRQRLFVLEPLSEITDQPLPVLGKTARELIEEIR